MRESDASLTKEEAARKYAPILRFAEGERYFPTIPFFTAFDGRDNPSGNGVDFADPDEIAPLSADGEPVWSSIRDRYDELENDEKFAIAAAFYRTREVRAKAVRAILRTDGPRFYRLGDEIRRYLSGDGTFTVYEYYFYYVNDTGIQGHPEDIEFFFVFVPDAGNFLIQAGGAHSEGDGNNVALIEWPEGSHPREFAATVELGGHAMAPDVPPIGPFRPGADANWHFGDAWGIRDVVAIVGSGSLGPYSAWMSDTRDSSHELEPAMLNRKSRRPQAQSYVLIPAESFFGEDGIVQDWTDHDLESVKRALSRVAGLLPNSRDVNRSIAMLSVEARERLKAWKMDGVKAEGGALWEAKKHDISQHSAYTAKSPTVIFKPHLFGLSWPYPSIRVGSDDDGDAVWSPGVVLRLPLHGVRGWLGLHGAFDLTVEYRDDRPRDWLADLSWVRSSARRFSSFLAIGTDASRFRSGVGVVGRLNPWFLFSRSVRLEGRIGAYWRIDHWVGSGPSFELSISLPWGARNY